MSVCLFVCLCVSLFLVYLTSVHMGFMSDTKNTFKYIHSCLIAFCRSRYEKLSVCLFVCLCVSLFLVYLTSVHMGFMSDTKNTFTYMHNYLFNCFLPKQVQKTGLGERSLCAENSDWKREVCQNLCEPRK